MTGRDETPILAPARLRDATTVRKGAGARYPVETAMTDPTNSNTHAPSAALGTGVRASRAAGCGRPRDWGTSSGCVIVFWVASEEDKQALMQDELSPFPPPRIQQPPVCAAAGQPYR